MKTYGKVHWNEGRWVIQCEPHVSIRLKRVFGGLNPREFGTLTISATAQNSRDLEWFLTRYPMELVGPARTKLRELAHQYKEQQALVDALLSARRMPMQFPLRYPLREYQRFAADMWRTCGGLLLADDVGLGKTAVAIAGMNHTEALPTLVVTLSHLPEQWKAECQKFAPHLDVHILSKGTPYDIARRRRRQEIRNRFPDVIISNYHKLAGWAETLAPVVRSVVFDECQELRHAGTAKYGAASHIAENVPYRIGLSATPIYNYGGEVFNVLDVLCPGRVGTEEEFRREWCIDGPGNKPLIKDPKSFGTYAREEGLMLRRTRKEVGRELPEVTVVPHHINADPDSLKSLRGKAIELAKLILRPMQDFQGQKMQAASEFDMRMRQATGIAKAPFVADFVRFLVEANDEKVVLYGWHREVYDIWLERLRSLYPLLYTGTESARQKESAKQVFLNNPLCRVLIVSLRSGAGLDGLQQVSNICVFGELDWSPGVHEQAIGRLHRDGQDTPVTAYYLLSDEGSDPVVSDVLGLKKQQIEGLRDPNAELIGKLQVNADYIKVLAKKYLESQGE